jgi:hypothetical protein
MPTQYGREPDKLILFQLSDPDVPESDRAAVILQRDGKPVRVSFVGGAGFMGCGTYQFGIVMHQDVVVEHRHPGRADQLARVIESGSPEYDVVGLPFAGWAAGINQGWVLGVKGCCHAIGVCFVVVTIEHLNLVDVHQKHTAVPAALTFALNNDRGRPFDVKLAVSEVLSGADGAGLCDNLHVTVFDLPTGRLSFSVCPLREVLTVEKDDGIRRCGHRFACRAWIDNRRQGPVRVMNLPFFDFLFGGLPTRIDSSQKNQDRKEHNPKGLFHRGLQGITGSIPVCILCEDTDWLPVGW